MRVSLPDVVLGIWKQFRRFYVGLISILNALQDIQPSAVVRGVASQTAVGVLARNLPRLATGSSIQTLDRQWRSILIDNAVANGGWETQEVTEFWQSMRAVMEHQALANFILEMMALPQSTAGVERTFSKVNNNKIRLRNSLSVCTAESIVKVSEHFKGNFKINDRLAHLHRNAQKVHFEKYKKADLDDVDEGESIL